MTQMSFGAGGELIPVDVELRLRISPETMSGLKTLNRYLLDWLTFTMRLNLPEDVEKQARTIHRTILLLNQLMLTWQLAASTTPLGLLAAIPATFGMGYTFVETIGDITGSFT